MQAADVADHPGLVGQAQLPARTQALDLLGLQRSDVDAVVDRFACFGSACKVLNCKGFIGYLPLFGLNIYPWCGRFVDTI
ncbi:hypothetical protein ABZR39_13120, partial [Pseudomonas aeruginosa]